MTFGVSEIWLPLDSPKSHMVDLIGSVAALVSCYCFITAAAVIVRGIVSVVRSIVLSKAFKPFM